jgi:opacity protein-like surface antigen
MLVAAMAVAVPIIATAQSWSIQAGGAARGEFNDNYFFTPDDRQWAFTGSVVPFVTAVRRTETTDVSALLAVGANRVWTSSADSDYLSARLGLLGTRTEVAQTFSGGVSVSRVPSLQSEVTLAGVALTRVYVNNASANGAYSHALSERWSLGATAGAYVNRYDSLAGPNTLQNNRGYLVGATMGYAASSRTQLTAATQYSYFTSDVVSNDTFTATLGVAHDISPQIAVSASVGGFWTSAHISQLSASCPSVSNDCNGGLTRELSSDSTRRAQGMLYGASLRYTLSERTGLLVNLSQNLAPSSTGALSKSSNAAASLSYRFSERLDGRLLGTFARTTYPGTLANAVERTAVGEVGVSYALAERWTLDAGYRYTGTRYSQNAGQPVSNVVFVNVAFNWLGATMTNRIELSPDVPGIVGAGPLLLREHPSGAPDLTGVRPVPESTVTIPYD